jgi:hypothetical protein
VSGAVNVYYPTGNNFIFSSRSVIGGSTNTGMGFQVFELLGTGTQNTALGIGALGGSSTATNNVALGAQSGRFITDGSTNNLTANDSIFLGVSTKALASGQTNQIVIGYDATGLGSNTAVLGNASITTTALRGNVGIGTTAPSSKLHVAGALGTNISTYDSEAALKLTNTTGPSSWLLTSGVIGVNNSTFCIRQDSTGQAALTIMSSAFNSNVGIGVHAPAAKLHVVGDAVLTGNVGIGTTNPVADLDIAKTWNGPAINVTGASGTGTVATVTFATQAAAIPVGTTVVIAGINPSGYNGTVVVTASSVTSVSYTNATTATWSSGGTVQRRFTAINLNITDTASHTTSNLLDLQVGGVSQFYIRKDGRAYGTGIYDTVKVNGIDVESGGGNGFYVNPFTGNIGLGTGTWLMWGGSGIPRNNNGDTILLRDGAANTLALRNSTAAQTFNVYGTYSSITDYKRLTLTCSNTTGAATIAAPFNATGITITGASYFQPAGPTFNRRATITFAEQALPFPVGSTVTVTGVTPAGYNGTAYVTASTTTSVSYVKTSNPGAYSNGGTATFSGLNEVLIQGGSVNIQTTQASGLVGGPDTVFSVDDQGRVAIGDANRGGSDGITPVVIGGDLEVLQSADGLSGIIMTANDGSRWKLTVGAGGGVSTTNVYDPV